MLELRVDDITFQSTPGWNIVTIVDIILALFNAQDEAVAISASKRQ